MSTNNLRRNFNTEDSILVPGAFSASTAPRWYGSTGSKKLVISRDMRSDLFSTPQKDKQIADSSSTSRKLSKRVSFDTSNVEDEEQPQIRGALPAPDGSPSTQADETPRQNRSAIGSNGSLTPEGESTSSLAGVQEEDNLATPGRQLSVLGDTAPGKYWTQPPLEELQSMNRVQRQKVDNFVIGRDNVGSIAFLLPVDLSGIELDDLFKDIVHLEPRSATVYPVTAKKPPVGKGLNVPARITLEQSWPRSGRDKRITNDPKKFNRHVERLKRIEDTEFVSYDKDTGVWVFTVEHFTTYGLDDSDEDSDEEMGTVGQPAPEPILTQSQQMALDASPGSSMEDTFHFRRSIGLPGAFDEQEAVIEDVIPREESFLGVSSADSAPNDVRLSLVDEQADDMGGEYDLSDEEDMTRSPAEQHHAAEHDDFSSDDGQDIQRSTPGGVLRARMRALKESAGPVQLVVADGDDWTEMLRKTVSPMKRDRQLLKELNEASPSRQNGQRIDFDSNEQTDLRKSSVWRKSTTEKKDGFANGAQAGLDKGRGFATSIDLMNSLFERPKAAPQNLRASASASRGFPKVGTLVVS
jgi:nuclear pore complex protein Nup98-Nup96